MLDTVADAQDNGDEGNKESFVVNLHGLPYNATLDDVTDFLEGYQLPFTPLMKNARLLQKIFCFRLCGNRNP